MVSMLQTTGGTMTVGKLITEDEQKILDQHEKTEAAFAAVKLAFDKLNPI